MQEKMDIYIANVPFDDSNKSKIRPALVVSVDNKYVYVFKITSKYKNKSKNIKKVYYPIMDWYKAGLKKQSFVDTHITYGITKEIIFQHNPIGKLSKNDTVNLFEFISKNKLNK
ncbi:type II toxin-antitoxin system PemK/MazF family toxin [Apilactobacillus micheneri]|uniref:Toxin MazF n=1 Tax=Apilactobacillus micheneri TaxID=1899430 RepID=A0A9Q8IP58_9LACO|nr:type II toxin-antitoxin system PemK/MazF family toxin [Apilactobacillus micheneri]TPR40005.1 hypothetical protein DY121_03990 [Apilactobacillus micheneri]TPR41816.1 hypothetical protein DY123_04610 [Apilactobacillus micheneri]TPR44207.1 hypothetical protein DY130_03985 [Apilactobacillus micheneri]TPR45831.1 hypothetical protein DY128_03985 [Apilactobacillus micheneri]TPR50575.1 hypothetical protein DY037_01100 [Apilactobacillus micheneri]